VSDGVTRAGGGGSLGRAGAVILAVCAGVFRIFWKELFELRQKPSIPLALLTASLLVVWTSGKINIEQPKIGLFLYEGGASDVERSRAAEASDILKEFAHVSVIRRAGSLVDADAMQRAGASLAVVHMGGQWVVLHRFATARQEAEASQLAGLIGYSLRIKKPLSALLLEADNIAVAGFSSRMSALPGEPQLQLVPRTIALIIVFLPFVLATRSYAREVASGMLPVLLGLPSCGWGALAAGKIAACLWLVLFVLLVLFLAIDPMFGFSLKPGLLLQLGVQALAIFASACLGLLLAILARSQSQIHLSIAVYFLGLVLLSGFLFPLETASPAIRWASYTSPLTYSGKVLESWLFFGTGALTFPGDIAGLAVQAAAAAVLLTLTIALVRRRV